MIGINSPENLFNNLPVAAHFLGVDGAILEVNQRWLDNMGFTRAEVIGRPITDFVPVDQRAEAKERFRVKVNGGKVQNLATRTYVRNDGSQFYAISIDTVIPTLRGGNKVVLTAVIDLSDYKKSISRHLEERYFRDITSGVAHRLNNSSPIITLALNLLEKAIKDKEQLGQIREIKKVFNNFERLIREMLLYLKMSSQDNWRAEFVVEDAISQAIDNCQRRYQEKVNVAIAREYSADHVVFGRYDLMVLAIENIIENSFEAIMQRRQKLEAEESNNIIKENWSGRIKIVVETRSIDERFPVRGGTLEPGRYIAISISDNGIGIELKKGQGHMALESLEGIFDPFYSERDPAKKNGLGLSWAKSMLDQLSGDVSVESEAGSGTTINLFIPADQPNGRNSHGSGKI